MLPLHPPGVIGMPALTVKKVHVKDGTTVHPGDLLVEFDPSAVLEKKTQADHAVTAALWTAEQARRKVELHPLEVERAKLGVEKAKDDLETAKQARDTIREALEEALALKDITLNRVLNEDEKAIRRKRNVDLQKSESLVKQAEFAVRDAELKLKQAEAAKPLLDDDVQKANAEVARLKAMAAEATAVIDSYKLKAQVAGTIEQVDVAEGKAVGPASRTPLMYLIPSGPMVVRAEVEAEFAHKIDDYIGKTVTIRAGQNFADTYTGTARRVSGAFLPKRFGGDSLVSNQTRVLECLIDITDPAPAGKPALRPGQPVRVTFGQ
jgi:multidrug resistance efflux pump